MMFRRNKSLTFLAVCMVAALLASIVPDSAYVQATQPPIKLVTLSPDQAKDFAAAMGATAAAGSSDDRQRNGDELEGSAFSTVAQNLAMLRVTSMELRGSALTSLTIYTSPDAFSFSVAENGQFSLSGLKGVSITEDSIILELPRFAENPVTPDETAHDTQTKQNDQVTIGNKLHAKEQADQSLQGSALATLFSQLSELGVQSTRPQGSSPASINIQTLPMAVSVNESGGFQLRGMQSVSITQDSLFLEFARESEARTTQENGSTALIASACHMVLTRGKDGGATITCQGTCPGTGTSICTFLPDDSVLVPGPGPAIVPQLSFRCGCTPFPGGS